MCCDLDKRLKGHMSEIKPKSAKAQWVKFLIKNKRVPVLSVLQTCIKKEAATKAEIKCIRAALRNGVELLNKVYNYKARKKKVGYVKKKQKKWQADRINKY